MTRFDKKVSYFFRNFWDATRYYSHGLMVRFIEDDVLFLASGIAFNVLLCIIPLCLFRSRGALAVETWAPLYFLYAILAVRFVFVRAFQGGVPGYFDYLFPDLTVLENIMLQIEVRRLPRAEGLAQARRLIAMVGLGMPRAPR